MKNGLMKTRNPTDLIMTSTKMDWKYTPLLIQNAVACWRSCFCSHGKSSGRIFIQAKRIKRSICRHLRQRNAAHLTNAMKASNRWSVLKSADKSDEEIIKSFSVKTKWPYLHGKEKRHYYDSMDPFVITNIFYNLDLWLWSSNW
jgi:hypothetical protein